MAGIEEFPRRARGEAGAVRDACALVVDDLAQTPAEPDMSGLTLLTPLPDAAYGNPELQPLRGVASQPPGAVAGAGVTATGAGSHA